MLHQDIKSPNTLELKNQAKLHLYWKQSIKKVVRSNILKLCNVIIVLSLKLLEKHSVDIRRVTTKYKHTHAAIVEAFNRELAKLFFKPMDAQELQDPEKVSTFLLKT